MARQRGRAKTFCPSDIARDLSEDWRPLMDRVRRISAGMEDIQATQAGQPVDAVTAKGPIRLGLA